MTRFTVRRSLASAVVAGILLLQGFSAKAHPSGDFAAFLMRQQDYYRAISVYKELAFGAVSQEERRGYDLQVARAYRLAGRYAHAEHTLLPLVEDRAASTLWPQVHLELALSSLGMGLHGVGLEHAKLAVSGQLAEQAQLVQATVLLHQGELTVAQRMAHRVSGSSSSTVVRSLSRRVGIAARSLEHAPSKSPALAGLLSTLLPGAGQVYTGHHVDALQAFGFVGSFGFTTFMAYHYDHDRGNPYVLTGVAASVTAVLHLANILGAERTAQYFNARQREVILDPITRDIVRMPVRSP